MSTKRKSPDFAPLIRERRQALGLSQQKLAQLADCSLASVSLLERGYRPGRSEVIPAILSVLDIVEREQAA